MKYSKHQLIATDVNETFFLIEEISTNVISFTAEFVDACAKGNVEVTIIGGGGNPTAAIKLVALFNEYRVRVNSSHLVSAGNLFVNCTKFRGAPFQDTHLGNMILDSDYPLKVSRTPDNVLLMRKIERENAHAYLQFMKYMLIEDAKFPSADDDEMNGYWVSKFTPLKSDAYYTWFDGEMEEFLEERKPAELFDVIGCIYKGKLDLKKLKPNYLEELCAATNLLSNRTEYDRWLWVNLHRDRLPISRINVIETANHVLKFMGHN